MIFTPPKSWVKLLKSSGFFLHHIVQLGEYFLILEEFFLIFPQLGGLRPQVPPKSHVSEAPGKKHYDILVKIFMIVEEGPRIIATILVFSNVPPNLN